jgi:hypothetical protein
MLGEWFSEHGEALLRCEVDIDCAYLLYAPYAAVSSWVPDERYWGLEGHQIPRCGHQGVEEFSRTAQEAGYSVGMFELEAATPERMGSCRALAIQTAFFMEEDAQRKLAECIGRGERVFLSGELPCCDLRWRPCTTLKEAVRKALASGSGNLVHDERNPFVDGRFPGMLAAAGILPRVTSSDHMRAYVHRRSDQDEFFVFFFNFDVSGSHTKWIQFHGHRLDLTLGSKTCGVARIRKGRIVAHLVKGTNEVEGITDTISLRLGDQVVEGRGDFSSSQAK